MSSAAVDNVLPVLTSRFLVLREEEEEEQEQQGQEELLLPTDLFEDDSSSGGSPATTAIAMPIATAMVVSPGNSSSKDAMLWSDSIAHDHKHYNGNRNRNNDVNNHCTRRLPIPSTSTPPPPISSSSTLSSSSSGGGGILPVCGLFASFSSSPTSEKVSSMWQYTTYGSSSLPLSSSLSPRTTDAVHVLASNTNANAAAAWISPDDKMINAPMMTTTTTTPPSLNVVSAVSPPQHMHNNNKNDGRGGLPTIIRYRTCNMNMNMNTDYFDSTVTGGGGSSDDDDFEDYDYGDDEVSLLADDPDENDADVLPYATYDVLANIFDDEIDR